MKKLFASLAVLTIAPAAFSATPASAAVEAATPVATATVVTPLATFGGTKVCRKSWSKICRITPFYTPWCWKPC